MRDLQLKEKLHKDGLIPGSALAEKQLKDAKRNLRESYESDVAALAETYRYRAQ